MKQAPMILALDFDGVVCDGLIEYFQTAWKAYCQIWDGEEDNPPGGLAERFYALRPVVETGWEMPVLLRSLLLGAADDAILERWGAIAAQQIQSDGLNPQDLAAQVDGVRDRWIAADLEHWLSQHRFYPGVIERIRQVLASDTYVVIVTTKEGRFVRQLLQQQGIELSDAQIWGKEVKQPKYETLRQLRRQFCSDRTLPSEQSVSVWFVEDRLKTLLSVQSQPDLTDVQLYLADWGYNIAPERQQAKEHLHLLSLEQFSRPFSEWLG
jgi:phosphoglycolate phosphatase-like HAD superfamily hydrolase